MTRARVRYQLAVSIDGLIGPPDGGTDWLSPYEAMAMEIVRPFMKEIGGLIMGRATQELLQSMGAGPFDEVPSVVLSSNPALEVGPMARVCSAGPRAAIEMLDARVAGGDYWLFGGGIAASSFLDEDLVDTIELTVVPVVLGRGKPLFASAKLPSTFELVSSRAGAQGTLLNVYQKLTE